ncbi:MAG: adenosylcobinamide amidohydrolase [Candidatus Nitronauta litoralis]|uniref:Adenosylcobinamide amidohydrolase n=1 Tax=Candidatus Nitronauta litoralis TaxID=2705533 RepID=A0A7T0BWV7_9BACT|nr:MAG: adenosylcobinamide amidohydrolase [Candidatus Nitronauta litoralis]
MKPKLTDSPLSIYLVDKTLVIQFPDVWQTLSWAPFNGGWGKSSCIFIHHLNKFDERDLDKIFEDQIKTRGIPENSVGLITGAATEHFKEVFYKSKTLWVHAIATLGLSNARTAGDEADAPTTNQPGTINLIVATNALPELTGNLEAVHTATMAKSAALMEAGIRSKKSGQIASGTGTDCIVICSTGEIMENYCGMHTLLGELIGKAVRELLGKSIAFWKEKNIEL